MVLVVLLVARRAVAVAVYGSAPNAQSVDLVVHGVQHRLDIGGGRWANLVKRGEVSPVVAG